MTPPLAAAVAYTPNVQDGDGKRPSIPGATPTPAARASQPPAERVSHAPADGPKESDLRHALQLLLRQLRGGRRNARGWLEGLASELLGLLHAELERRGAIHLRVGVDGFTHEGEKILDYSPRDDPAVFRLFQHGVRQLSFLPGLDRQELDDLLDVLTTDLTAAELVEEDITTLLASKELETIQFVVVETFSEGAQDEGGDRRAGDVAAIVAATLRETLSAYEGEGGVDGASTGGGDIRFWQADAKFLETADLPALMAELPRFGVAESGETATDPELSAFATELTTALVRPMPWLPDVMIKVLRGAEGPTLARLAASLANDVISDVEQVGLDAAAPMLRRVLEWVNAEGSSERGIAVATALFTPRLVQVAVAGIETRGGVEISIDLMRMLPDSLVPEALAGVCGLADSAARRAAIGALTSGGGEGLASAADLLGTLDGETALTILRAASRMPADSATLPLFRAASVHADAVVRIHALAWLAHRTGDDAMAAVTNALRDPHRPTRLSALWLLHATQARFARAQLKLWVESAFFHDQLDLDDKRLGMQVFALTAGPRALPMLRALAEKSTVLHRQKDEDLKASAVAALGLVVDDEALDLLQKLAKVRGTATTAQSEAQYVLDAWRTGSRAYADPFDTIADVLRQEALLEALEPVQEGRAEEITSATEVAAGMSPSLVAGVLRPSGAGVDGAPARSAVVPPPAAAAAATATSAAGARAAPPPARGRARDVAPIEIDVPNPGEEDDPLARLSFDDLGPIDPGAKRG